MTIQLTPGQQALVPGFGTPPATTGAPAEQTDDNTAGAAALQPAPVNGGATIGQRMVAKGSPKLDAFTAGLNAIAQTNPAPAAPGAWAKNLVAAVPHLLGNASSAFGDAAAAGEGLRPGQGWLAGAEKTASAHSERVGKEKQQQFANSQEAQKTAAQVAYNQAETMQISRNIQRQDAEARTSSANIGKAAIDAGRATHDTKDNIPDSAFQDMVKKNPDYMQTHYAQITAYEPMIGPDGKQMIDPKTKQPIENPTWSVQERAPKANTTAPVTMTKAVHDDWVAAGMKNVPDVGVEVPYDSFHDLAGTAHTVANTVHLANQDRNEQLTDEQIQQNHDLFAKPAVANAIAADPAHGAIGGIQKSLDIAKQHDQALTAQLALAQKKGDTAAVQKLQSTLADVKQQEADINKAYSTFTAKDKQDYAKDLEKERVDNADIRQKNAAADKDQADALKTKNDAAMEGTLNPAGANDLTGETYLNALPVGPRNVIKAIAEGRETRSSRQLQDKNGNPSPLAISLHRAYPDLDITNLTAYSKLREKFETGKESIALNGGGTALKHLSELQQLNTNKSRIPGTDDYNAYNNKLDTLAGELLTFYGTPLTNENIAGIKKTLGATFNRDSAIKTQIGSMGDKLVSYEQTWKNGQPRPSYTPPMPSIDPEAKAALIRLDPQFAKAHPSLSTVNMKAPDGTIQPVSADQVDHFKSLGATVDK
jgi:hypothetical protein